MSYQTFLGTATNPLASSANISIQAGVFCTAPVGTTPGSGFTTFVFEPVENPTLQAQETGQWQTWDATSGDWWTTHAFSSTAGGGSGSGSLGGQSNVEPFAMLVDQFENACPNAGVVEMGLGLGSNNPGITAWADNLQYTTSAGSENWNFQSAAAPAAPTGVTATGNGTSAVVSFTPPSNTGGTPITSYTVNTTDTTHPANIPATAPTGSSSPITVSGLTLGDSYTFTVTATNGVGPGPASAPSAALVLTALPGAPTIGTATAGNGSASVAFTAPVDPGTSPITLYTVTAADSTTPGNGGQTATGTTSPITVPGLTNGDSYTFTVTATNGSGAGPASVPSNAVTPTAAPGPPENVSATAGNQTATVSFSAPANNGGSPITFYTASALDSTFAGNGGQQVSGAGSPLTFNGLVNGDTYTFTVTATSVLGTGPPSSASNAVTPSTATTGGGSGTGGTTPPGGVSTAPTSTGAYDLVGSDGGVFVFGQPGTGFYGSLPGQNIRVNNIVGIVPTNDGRGYFLVGSDGGVFTFGDAGFYNSLPGIGIHINDIVGIVPTSDDKGYFLVGRDGGVFTFGDAPFENSLPGLGIHLKDISGIAATPDNKGYWVVASSGAVYAFGDAKNLGSATSGPIVSITSTLDGGGYWLTSANGSVFTYGDAGFFNSLPGIHVAVSNIVSLVPSPDGKGYLLIGGDGGIFAFGDATFPGSLPGQGVHVTNIVGAVPVV
ncbi:MAG TPA: fibronectin type III domain-containing protein [Acidimicrobiales bacterium]|nr:fibronectin type III domain-containing protein [Acidimicrobiales bacterium]